MLSKLHPSALIIALCLVAALGALSTAWTSQYGFGLFPCELCLYQRLPYIGVVVCAGLGLLFQIDIESRRLLSYLIGLLFLTTAGVAFFHVGVEQEWWQSSCAPTGPQAFSFDDIRSALQKPGRPACNDIPFELFGISMAGYNFIAALGLGIASLWAAKQNRYW